MINANTSELPEAVGGLPEGMGGFQPLQPIPDAALAETLEKVREEEQLQQLQVIFLFVIPILFVLVYWHYLLF